MAKYLVIVESPAKAKTIKKFLGSSYKVEASMGHVRDLPKSELGVNLKDDFEPKYITIRGKGEILSKLRKEVKNADKVYLATDPDREGEAISWHLLHALHLDEKNTSRITFNEITKNAVKNSIKQARKIDLNLVDAQQARRILDRIVGYEISPILWKKVKKGLSAGRVQSVALRMICDREEEISNFISEEYWTIEAEFTSKNNKRAFKSKFYGVQGEKIAIHSKQEADEILSELNTCEFIVKEVKKGERIRRPMPPFITSTLQQEASKYIGFSTQKTMMVAQQLYEGIDIKGEGTVGLVSYIRTDSVRISDEAYEDVKSYILTSYGDQYINPEKIEYKTKGKSQDAHEAIRPTSVIRTPERMKESLTKDQFKLYKLIWDRFVASQMSPAQYDTLSVKIHAGKYRFRSSGALLRFDGFLAVYNKSDEIEEGYDIPELQSGEILKTQKMNGEQHFTQPPARYTEAALVKALEEIGVGRPSTYAPTITTVLQRGYVNKEKKSIFPTELGEIVNEIMKNHFKEIVNTDFTANLEDQLDHVEEGEVPWKEVIRDFYVSFEKTLKQAEEEIGEVEIEDEVTEILCEKCGKNMVIKYGRFGKFLACPGFPECRNAKPLYEDAGVKCPLCEGAVQVKKTKKGRKYFGCENNPECSFMTWNKPTNQKCPKCGDVLVEKGSKEIKVVCNNATCGYVEQEQEKEDTETQ